MLLQRCLLYSGWLYNPVGETFESSVSSKCNLFLQLRYTIQNTGEVDNLAHLEGNPVSPDLSSSRDKVGFSSICVNGNWTEFSDFSQKNKAGRTIHDESSLL